MGLQDKNKVNSFLESTSSNCLQSEIETLKSLWMEFIRKRAPITNYLKPHIANSWERSLNHGVNLTRPVPKVLAKVKLQERLEWSREFLEAMEFAVQCLLQSTEGLQCAIGYVDSEGYVLKLFGDSELLNLLERFGFVVGANWREEYVGTTAVGITLNTGQPAQVLHAEHFCQDFKQFSCTAAPVFDPDEGKMAGVIDFVFRIQHHHPTLIGMATQIAKVIELTVEKGRKEREEIFRDLSIQLTLDHMDKGVIIVDKEGRIRRLNLKAIEILGLDRESIIGSNIKQIQDLNGFLERNINKGTVQIKGKILHIEMKPITYFDRTIGDMYILEAYKQQSDPKKHMQTIPDVVGDSLAYKEVIDKAINAAKYNCNILITGETGTGKEVIARFIHEHSERKSGPLVVINCGAIPKELIGSELFGYESGAFTGARQRGMVGKFELAHKGTLILDEISEMPLDAQVYLLRVIEERMVTRLGSSNPKPVNVRIIAISNKDLNREAEEGRFRADLLFRLNVFKIHIPPLRNRKEDIITLSHHFLKLFSEAYKKRIDGIDKATLNTLLEHSWPGNVRELKNAIEHAVIVCDSNKIEPHHLPIEKMAVSHQTINLKEIVPDNALILTKSVYDQCRGNISKMAKILGVSRPTVYAWLKKYNIQKIS